MAWKLDWSDPPDSSDELFAWRVYTRCWNDIGARAPGIWVSGWMRKDMTSEYMMEAIHWYMNECKE